jgi:hypothetical protein
MINIFLECRDVSIGYPDVGHDEYFLVRSDPRNSRLIQYLFGNKKTDLLCYGRPKPGDDELREDIESYTNREISNSRDSKLKEMGI